MSYDLEAFTEDQVLDLMDFVDKKGRFPSGLEQKDYDYLLDKFDLKHWKDEQSEDGDFTDPAGGSGLASHMEESTEVKGDVFINENKSNIRKMRTSLVKLHEDIQKNPNEANSPEAKPKRKAKLKVESVMDRIKEIEKKGSIAALEAKMNALDEEIEGRQGRLTMVSENEDIAEFVNQGRVKEIQKEIKDFTKAKEKYGKAYEKMEGKAYVKPVMDNT